MRLLLVSDAWAPQVNGVVRTLQAVTARLRELGHEVEILSPDRFRSVPCPTYPEIRLAFVSATTIADRIALFSPDSIHIATEGPLGVAARRCCLEQGFRFTTAYHTRFPEYLTKRTCLPASWFWRYIEWFHKPSAGILVSTTSVARQLHERGLPQARLWSRGVDTARFNEAAVPHPLMAALPHPIQLYVGRVAVEKNIEAFLSSKHPGTKVVVGAGPQSRTLSQRYPDAVFLGMLEGDALASAYAAANVFVFPSRTDTFGLVMIEALSCGSPVAAFPVAGPADVLRKDVGCMDVDLDRAIAGALPLSRKDCAAYGRTFSWDSSARQFLQALVPLSTEGAVSLAA